MTKTTSSNRSAFSKRQFNADTYHNSTCIAAERLTLALNRMTLCNEDFLWKVSSEKSVGTVF